MPETNFHTHFINEFHSNTYEAFCLLYKLECEGLGDFIVGLIQDQSHADAILMYTLNSLMKQRKQFKNYKGIRAYLYITARNQCQQYAALQNKLNKSNSDPQIKDRDEKEIDFLLSRLLFSRNNNENIDRLKTKLENGIGGNAELNIWHNLLQTLPTLYLTNQIIFQICKEEVKLPGVIARIFHMAFVQGYPHPNIIGKTGLNTNEVLEIKVEGLRLMKKRFSTNPHFIFSMLCMQAIRIND